MSEEKNEATYLIAHIGHTIKSDEHITWWKPGGRGYTICIDKAGRFTAEEVWTVCCTGENIAVPVSAVEPLALSTPYYRRSDGRLAKLYDGEGHRPVQNSKESWSALFSARLFQTVKPSKPTPIAPLKARAIYLDGDLK